MRAGHPQMKTRSRRSDARTRQPFAGSTEAESLGVRSGSARAPSGARARGGCSGGARSWPPCCCRWRWRGPSTRLWPASAPRSPPAWASPVTCTPVLGVWVPARLLLRSRRTSSKRAGLLSLPQAAQGPVSRALGADDPAYSLRASNGAFAGSSPAQHSACALTARGYRSAPRKANVGLSLRAVGYGSSLRALGPVAPRAKGNRLT